MRKLLLSFLVALFTQVFSYAAVRTALVTGNWENAATWSGGVVPTCGDSVVIPAGKVVTITTQLDYTGCGGPMAINIFGELNFQTGKKLSLACGSVIYVQTGGSITSSGGGGSANLISICGQTVWTSSMGTVNGPVIITSGGIQPLPVELVYFSARIESGKTIFNWSTATETNNNHFEIQHSLSGQLFESIANVPAAGAGTSLVAQSYAYIYWSSEGAYYRLKQVDKNGNWKFYPIVQALPVAPAHLTVLPNPATSILNISVGDTYLNSTVNILNNLGQTVFMSSTSDYNNVLDVSFLNAGLYYVIVNNAASRQVVKLTIHK